MNQKLERLPEESEKDYCFRICELKDLYDLSWQDVANLLNDDLNYSYSPDKYRKEYYKCKKVESENQVEMLSELDNSLLDIRKEKVKLQEERTQINSLVRALAREETLKEIALEAVSIMSGKKYLCSKVGPIVPYNGSVKGILVISDWHYGIDVDTFYNKYNPEVARARVDKLLMESINIIKKECIQELYLLNLGDMISGIIHLPLRINSRLDVVSQTMQVSEILSEFITNLSNYCKINYYSVTDNHSRLDPNKKESLQPESFVRIIDWYLKKRLENNPNVAFFKNIYGDDICSFDIFDHKVLAVHGDKDPQKKVLSQLTAFTQEHFDLILSAHRHHFYADEYNETELYSNGSLMGTDDYAASLRCNNKPSQLLIVCDKNNISKVVYKIKLD